MDDLFILIYLVLILGFLIVAFAFPIVALVISIRTKRKLSQRLTALEAAHGIIPTDQSSLRQLELRVQRLEDTLQTRPAPVIEPSVVTPPPPPVAPSVQKVSPPPVVQPSSPPAITANELES